VGMTFAVKEGKEGKRVDGADDISVCWKLLLLLFVVVVCDNRFVKDALPFCLCPLLLLLLSRFVLFVYIRESG
jgi:hypothetical protein